MKYDEYGIAHCTEEKLCELLYKKPDLDFNKVLVDDPTNFNNAIKQIYSEMPLLKQYQKQTISIVEFDKQNQSEWLMPPEYKEMDIAKWVLDTAKNDEELQRLGEELLMAQSRNLMDLFRYLKYLVDTMRKNNIVWGVGRGSSVASFVLYKIGIHKINSLYYELDPQEFFK